MRETKVEQALCKAIQRKGGLCLKFVSPGHRGVPDRLCLMPGGVVGFVEVKRPGARLDPAGLQAAWQRQLQRLGLATFVVDSVEEAGKTAALLEWMSVCARERDG